MLTAAEASEVVAISTLLFRYAYELDRGDFAEAARLFTYDARFEVQVAERPGDRKRSDRPINGPLLAKGRANVATLLSRCFPRPSTPAGRAPWPLGTTDGGSYHRITNTIIEADGPRADVRALVHGIGVYDCEVHRGRQGWQLRRVCLVMTQPHTLEDDPALTETRDPRGADDGVAVSISPSEMAHIMSIRQLWAQYTFAVDSHDYRRVAELFTDHGIFEIRRRNTSDFELDKVLVGGEAIGACGRGNIQEFLHQAQLASRGSYAPSPWPAGSAGNGMYHQITNELITVNDDRAQLHCYLNGYATYSTTFVLTEDGWLIEKNLVVLDEVRRADDWKSLRDEQSDSCIGAHGIALSEREAADAVAAEQSLLRALAASDTTPRSAEHPSPRPLHWNLHLRDTLRGSYTPVSGFSVGAEGNTAVLAHLREVRWNSIHVSNFLVKHRSNGLHSHSYLWPGGTLECRFEVRGGEWVLNAGSVILDTIDS